MIEKVEIFDVWAPVETGGDAIRIDGQHMALVARIASDGTILRLAQDYFLEKRSLSKEEFSNFKPK
jgi:hypothetical protein